MSSFVVITSGATPEIGEATIRRAREIITSHHASISTTSTPRRPAPTQPWRMTSLLPMLALWGLHHSRRPITAHALQMRVELTPGAADRLIARLLADGLIETVNRKAPSNGDRSVPMYQLTQQGGDYVRRWFTHMFQGYRLTVHTGPRMSWKHVVEDLRRQHGLIVLTSNGQTPRPVPNDFSTLMLIAAWVLEESNIDATVPAIARRVQSQDELVQTQLASLHKQGLIIPGAGLSRQSSGTTQRAVRFRLTEKGHTTTAHGYLATLLS